MYNNISGVDRLGARENWSLGVEYLRLQRKKDDDQKEVPRTYLAQRTVGW